MNKRELERKIELEWAKIRQAETHYERAEAKARKALAALLKFYAKGPREKKKSGRPGFWKSRHGLFFVQEVERIARERQCKTVTAIKEARKATAERAKQAAKADGIKDPLIALAAILAKQSHEELQVRYQEARRYWLFLIDPESHQKQKQSLENNFNEANSSWTEAIDTWATAWREAINGKEESSEESPIPGCAAEGALLQDFP